MNFAETTDRFMIVKIHNLMPKRFRSSQRNVKIKDTFLLLANEDGKLVTFQDLGYSPNAGEIENIRHFMKLWGGGEDIEIRNGILQMPLPNFMKPFVDRVMREPGCRISPNLLRIDDDVYISIEFPAILSQVMEEIVTKFIAEDHLFKKELFSSGHKKPGLPTLLRIYEEAGNNLDDFVIVTTIWEFDQNRKKVQNQGLFTNTGNYVPKGFYSGLDDILIYQKHDDNVTGSQLSTIVDPATHLFEFKVTSKFVSDFYNLIIKEYTGPIFVHSIVSEESQISYYIISANHQEDFIDGLNKHWNREARRNHSNHIESIENVKILDT